MGMMVSVFLIGTIRLIRSVNANFLSHVSKSRNMIVVLKQGSLIAW